MAVGFLVVEAIEPHIRLADFLGTVVKRIRRVHSAGNYHALRRREHQSIAADNGFRGDFVDFGHNGKVLECYNLCDTYVVLMWYAFYLSNKILYVSELSCISLACFKAKIYIFLIFSKKYFVDMLLFLAFQNYFSHVPNLMPWLLVNV